MTDRLCRRAALSCLAAAALFMLGACAPIPPSPAPASPRELAPLASARSLPGTASAWPQSHWWSSYGDPQLGQLVEEALRDAPSLAAAQARLRKAVAFVEQSEASHKPSVSGSASLGQVRQSYHNGVPFEAVPKGWNTSAGVSLNFSYEIDFFGRHRAAIAAAASQAAAAQMEAEQTRLALTTSIATAYASLAGYERELELAQETLRIRSNSADLVLRRRSRGLETVAVEGQANAAVETARSEASSLREQIRLAQLQIAALVGAGPDRSLEIGPTRLAQAAAQGLPNNVTTALLAHRPDVLAARLLVEAEAANVQVARTGFYPSVNLSAMIGQQVLGLGDLLRADSRVGSVGPAISLPIFQPGLKGQLRASEADYDEAVERYNETLLTALQQLAANVTSQAALAEQRGFALRAESEALRAYQAAELRYRGGLSSYLDALTAENTLIDARRAVARLDTRSFTLDVALVRALGGGFRSA